MDHQLNQVVQSESRHTQFLHVPACSITALKQPKGSSTSVTSVTSVTVSRNLLWEKPDSSMDMPHASFFTSWHLWLAIASLANRRRLWILFGGLESPTVFFIGQFGAMTHSHACDIMKVSWTQLPWCTAWSMNHAMSIQIKYVKGIQVKNGNPHQNCW